MKNIFIVGGSGFARECYNTLIYLADYGKEITFGGFLGYKTKEFGEVNYKTYQHLYKGDVDDYEFGEDDYVIIGSGDINLRREIYENLKARGVEFYTLISIDSVITETSEIGEACILQKSALSVNVKIGKCNILNGGVNVGHDAEIGDFNVIAPRTTILGGVKIGDFNSIGTNAVLLPHAKIGNNNKIAPLSAVYRGCKDNCYMIGNPALKEGSTL